MNKSQSAVQDLVETLLVTEPTSDVADALLAIGAATLNRLVREGLPAENAAAILAAVRDIAMSVPN